MSKIKVKISEATAEQLQQFAIEATGGNFSGQTIEKLRAQAKAANSGEDTFEILGKDVDNIELGTPQPPRKIRAEVISDGSADSDGLDSEDVPFAPAEKPDRGDELIPIMIQISDKEGGQRPVPVAVNGTAILIPRGKPCEVKRKYVEVLAHAIEQHAVLDDQGRIIGMREVHAYPFSINGPVSREIQRYQRVA